MCSWGKGVISPAFSHPASSVQPAAQIRRTCDHRAHLWFGSGTDTCLPYVITAGITWGTPGEACTMGGGVRGDMENAWLVMVIITVSYSRGPRQGGMWHSPENGPRGTPVFFMLPILPMGVLNQLQVGGIYTFLTSWQERFLRRLFKKLLRASFESILPWLTCRVSMKLEPVLLTLRKDAKKGPQFY